MRTPLSRVLHYGSAHEGTGHFWRQRLTGASNAVLAIAVVAILIAAAGQPYESVVALLGKPWVAAVLVLFFVSVSIHMRLGMQVVVEDYIHGDALKVVLLAASTFFSVAVAAVAILAVLKLSLGG